MKVRWCGNGHHNFTHVEEKGKVATAILLLYLVPSEKAKTGAPHQSHSREEGNGVTMAILLPDLVVGGMAIPLFSSDCQKRTCLLYTSPSPRDS